MPGCDVSTSLMARASCCSRGCANESVCTPLHHSQHLVRMDELRSRIASLEPNPPLYKDKEPETWSSLCATVGNAVNVTQLVRTYGAPLVRDIKKAGKLGGIYEDIHPQIAARYRKGVGSSSCQSVQTDAGRNMATGLRVNKPQIYWLRLIMTHMHCPLVMYGPCYF